MHSLQKRMCWFLSLALNSPVIVNVKVLYTPSTLSCDPGVQNVKDKINKDCGKSHALPAIIVRPGPGSGSEALLCVQDLVFPSIIGRSGRAILKREGDGSTPLGTMRMVNGFYRADRLRIPQTNLPMVPIRRDMGWCDAPAHASYNHLVRLPFAASHERMYRADRLYDVCIVLDWNVAERRRNRGSAIFWHLTHETRRPTEGCIAIEPAAMLRLLPLLQPGMAVCVV
ncbi:MAG: L,D-transpeptidase family protein [Pseudomonadota bacterium]